MREGAVGFRHAMRVFALLDGVAAIIGCIHQLTRKPGGHGILRAVARSAYQPADGQRLGAVRADLDRHLLRRTTDAAAADLDARLNNVELPVEPLTRPAISSGVEGIQSANGRVT